MALQTAPTVLLLQLVKPALLGVGVVGLMGHCAVEPVGVQNLGLASSKLPVPVSLKPRRQDRHTYTLRKEPRLLVVLFLPPPAALDLGLRRYSRQRWQPGRTLLQTELPKLRGATAEGSACVSAAAASAGVASCALAVTTQRKSTAAGTANSVCHERLPLLMDAIVIRRPHAANTFKRLQRTRALSRGLLTT